MIFELAKTWINETLAFMLKKTKHHDNPLRSFIDSRYSFITFVVD